MTTVITKVICSQCSFKTDPDHAHVVKGRILCADCAVIALWDRVAEEIHRRNEVEDQRDYNRALLRDERRHRARAQKELKHVARQRDQYGGQLQVLYERLDVVTQKLKRVGE